VSGEGAPLGGGGEVHDRQSTGGRTAAADVASGGNQLLAD
jgi:hypothetical protein